MVLIETLWNVKRKNKVGYSLPFLVLIETLWNVKSERRKRPRGDGGINRNIVECKDRWTAEYQDFSGINRNIVECKASFSLNCTDGRPVLIETLWNVKAFS